MKVLIVLTTTILAFAAQINALSADVIGEDRDARGSAMTGPEAVRVTILRMGGVDHVQAVSGGSPGDGCAWSARPGQVTGPNRSEEHTAELQSLMRTSYDVICLYKTHMPECASEESARRD